MVPGDGVGGPSSFGMALGDGVGGSFFKNILYLHQIFIVSSYSIFRINLGKRKKGIKNGNDASD